MFSDGSYLFDAGWLFFSAWSLVLLAIFAITFGQDILGIASSRTNSALSKASGSLHSANSPHR
jgi:hypothetical protein